jgi:hypothetical protein
MASSGIKLTGPDFRIQAARFLRSTETMSYLLPLAGGVRKLPHGSAFCLITGLRFIVALYASSVAFSSAFFFAASAFWRSDSGKFSCA